MSIVRHIHADLLGAATSRTLRVAVPCIVAFAALVTAGLVTTYGTENEVADLATAWGQGEVLVDPLSGLLVAAVLATFWGAAHRDGAILWSFLAGAGRWRVAVSALVVALLVALVTGVLAAAAKIGTLTALAPSDVPLVWSSHPHGTWAVGGGIFAVATFSLTATCLAFLLRHGAATLGVLFTWVLLVEPLVAGLLPREGRPWLPGHALIAVRDHVPDVSTVAALATSLGYTAALVAVTLVVVARRDPA